MATATVALLAGSVWPCQVTGVGPITNSTVENNIWNNTYVADDTSNCEDASYGPGANSNVTFCGNTFGLSAAYEYTHAGSNYTTPPSNYVAQGAPTGPEHDTACT